MTVIVRKATLDDVGALTAIHTASIERWQRLTLQGQVEDVPYEQLTVHERWQHGGPWMSPETCAVYLNHLSRGLGIALAIERDGQIVAGAEVFPGEEPAPFGACLDLSLTLLPDERDPGAICTALLAFVRQLAEDTAHPHILMTQPLWPNVIDHLGLTRIAGGQSISWPVRQGQVFYQATPHEQDDPAQINGYALPLGRWHSAHYEWVTRWPSLWAGVPALRDRRVERLQLSVAGGRFFVMFAESPYDSRQASLYLWTPTPLLGPMLTAVNDKAHKLGFRRLDTTIVGQDYAFLGPDAEPDGVTYDIYGLDVTAEE